MTIDFLTRADLFHEGMTRRSIDAAVFSGALIRARRDRYLLAGTDDAVERAVRVGGCLTCLSLLQVLGVFVLRNTALHVHLDRTASRLRSPTSRETPLATRARGVRLHWRPLSIPVGQSATVHVIDALAHSILCQSPRAAIATLDSALHQRLITTDQLDDVFALVPAKYQVLRALIDGRAESGSESLMRLLLRNMGCEVAVQVVIPGVGRVDLLVDGWLVVECDSEEFHSGWDAQERDRRRDLALAVRGYARLRPTAKMVFDESSMVLAGVRSLLDSRLSAAA